MNKIDETVLLNFLTKTKEGSYAEIEETSLDYIRIKEQSENIDTTSEVYYYTIC